MLSRFLFFQSRVVSYCSYIYIYTCVSIYSQLFIRATHTSDFHASSFPRNWREIVEHQAFPRNQNVPQFEVDASSCVTQQHLEPSVLFSFPFSFLFFIFTFPFRSTMRRIVTWRSHQSLLCLFCQELKSWKGRGFFTFAPHFLFRYIVEIGALRQERILTLYAPIAM